MIIETCPECGHDLINLVLTVYPPIPKKQCTFCDWSWTGQREDIIRVPFNSVTYEPYTPDYIQTTIDDIADINLFGVDLNNISYTDGTIGTLNQAACTNCPNNIKNSVTSTCSCTLGSSQITY